MRPAAIFTGFAGIGIVVGLIVAGGQKLDATDTDELTGAAVVDSKDAAPAAQPTTNPQSSMNARPIDAASQFYPADVDGKPLERMAMVPPELPKPTVAEKGVALPRPVAENAGVLSFRDRRLQLAGLTPTPDDKTCAAADGTEWPCGMLAKTNFRLFLRLRTVNCDLDSTEWTGTVTAPCKIGTQDLSQWLVENGWAAAESGSPLAETGDQARHAKRGVYGDDPRKAVAAPSADDIPPDGSADPL